MPATPRSHFDDDLDRARALQALVGCVPAVQRTRVHDDVLRSAWMFAVGAMDAYFSDAYVDLIARTLIARSVQPRIALPRPLMRTAIPVGWVLASYTTRPNMMWRIAARRMMDDEAMTSLDKIQQRFNSFFRDNHKFWGDLVPTWMAGSGGNARRFGVTRAAYTASSGRTRGNMTKKGVGCLKMRMSRIVQRRHDCIHNCDRPKVSPQTIKPGSVQNAILDIEFFVHACDGHIDTEFKQFLIGCGCSGVTLNRVGY